jgi:peptide/nickel transport system substrate-binding protein
MKGDATARWIATLVAAGLFAVACSGGGTGVSTQEPESPTATGDGEGAPTAVEVLRIANDTDLNSWDPHQEGRNIVMHLYQLVYDSLVNEDASGDLVPGLATEWTIEPEAVEFTLREGVVFHDGTPFDAEAAKANLEHVRTEGIPSIAERLAAVEEIVVVDPLTLRLELSGPAPALLPNLARFPGLMVSPEVLGTEAAATAPVGTGPWAYVPADSQPGSKYVFEAHTDAWDTAQITVPRVEVNITPDTTQALRALQTGQLDAAFVEANLAAQAETAGFELANQESFHLAIHLFDREGTRVPALADERVRRAISLALNRQEFFDTVQNGWGIPSVQRFLEGQVGHAAEGLEDLEYNLEAAKALMAEAGVDKVTLKVPSFGPFDLWNEAIAGFLSQIGVTLDISAITPGTLFQAPASGEYDAALMPIPELHPSDVYGTRIAADGFLNPFGVAHPDVDALAAQANEDEDLWAEVMAGAVEQGIFVELGSMPGVVAYDPDVIADPKLWRLVPGSLHLRSVELAR